MTALEASAALEGSEVRGSFFSKEEKGWCLRTPVKTVFDCAQDLSLSKITAC